jgi:hypothetical protein
VAGIVRDAVAVTSTTSSATDFDFLYGSWKVAHRRLRERLTDCNKWDEFAGTAHAWPILGGCGNIDDNVLELPGGTYRAGSIRAFDASTSTWAIWWLDSRHPHHLDVPVIGTFTDGIGEFTAADEFNGRPIIVRFRWTDTRTESPRWDQAFSPDDGATWETNWTMTFTRNESNPIPRR